MEDINGAVSKVINPERLEGITNKINDLERTNNELRRSIDLIEQPLKGNNLSVRELIFLSDWKDVLTIAAFIGAILAFTVSLLSYLRTMGSRSPTTGSAFQVNALGLGLVVVAFLAGGGSLFLGEKTLRLSEYPVKTENTTEDEVKDHTRALASGSDELEKIADIVMERLNSQLKIPLGDMSGKISRIGDAAASQVEAAEKDALAPLAKRSESISVNLNHLQETVTADDVELQKMSPALDRLKGVGVKLDEVADKLTRVEANEQVLAGSVARAENQANLAASHAEAAQQSAELASGARKKVELDLQAINSTAAEQERALGAAGARIDNLNNEIKDSETKLRNPGPIVLDSIALTQIIAPLTARVAKVEDRLDHPPLVPAPLDLGPLTERVGKVEDRLDHPPLVPAPLDLGPLTERVGKVEDRLDHLEHPPAPSFPTTEAELGLEQKKQIQKTLHVHEDGVFGTNTRLMIQRYRTGDLTPYEIKALLSARDH